MKTVFLFVVGLLPVWALYPGSRIIGGENTYAGQYPFAAAIYKSTPDGTYFCTGSILTREWVITAGQCVDGAILFTILLGTHKLSGESTQLRVAAETYVLHPDYDPLTLANDIGLIKFRTPLTFTTYIRSLSLPFFEMKNTSSGYAYGWGQTSDDDPGLSDTLNRVWLTRVPDDECRITYGAQLLENMACFSGNYNEGACYGDAGSPVIEHVSKTYFIVIAISSFFSANGCESTDPSGYTAVWPYNDWINSIVEAET